MSLEQEKVRQIVKNLGFQQLNELQTEVLEQSKNHSNLLVLSKTGSGKTVAFLLPTFLKMNKNKDHIQSLIIAPTRELALQIDAVFRAMKTDFKVSTCYGGHSMRTEINSLQEIPAVVIGTPGRICDHIERGHIDLSKVEQFVIDEYDKCLEFGFEDQIRFIRERMVRLKNTTLVSATELKEFPTYLNFGQASTINFIKEDDVPDIRFHKLKINKTNKYQSLLNLLCSFQGDLTIVFCNFREASEEISNFLDSQEYESVYYHGGLEQDERERALIKFRNNSVHTLICTDLGSRGLDIPEVKHIVHFQYPHNKEAFIHRNGRTARMEKDGDAYLLINSDEQVPDYLDIPADEVNLPTNSKVPVKSKWITIYFSAGKKDKVNKIDLVGFLGQKGKLKKEDIGLITVLDNASYVAVPRKNIQQLLNTIRPEKVKGKKLRIAISK